MTGARAHADDRAKLTRVADQAELVPDAIWDAAAEHFDEAQLGALVGEQSW